MNLVYSYLNSWDWNNHKEEDLQYDVGDINSLLKQLSANAPEVFASEVRSTVAHGSLAVVRDLDVPRGKGHRIVGMATLLEKSHLMGYSGIIEDVVVDGAYRGNGIGEKLNEILIAWAMECGFEHLDLTSSPHRVAANKLYQKLGYDLRETNVYRKKLN